MPATAQTESTNKRRRNRDNGANASTTHTAAPPVERVMPPPIPRDPLPPMFQEPSRFEQITYGTIKAGAIVLGASLIVAGITSIARNAMGWNAYRKTGQFPDWMNKR
jgi:hypothetical protein